MTQTDSILMTGTEPDEARLGELERMDAALASDERRLTELEKRRRVDKEKEQADVDRLHGHSPLVLWLTLTGALDSRMDKEVNESLQADALYDAVLRDLKAVREKRKSIAAELAALRAAERQDAGRPDTGRRDAGSHDAPKPSPVRETAQAPAAPKAQTLADLNHLYREIAKVMAVGDRTLKHLNEARRALKRAEDVSTEDSGYRRALWDHVPSDEMLAELDCAAEEVSTVVRLLADYRAGLASVASLLPEDAPERAGLLSAESLTLSDRLMPRTVAMGDTFVPQRSILSDLISQITLMQNKRLMPLRADVLRRRDEALHASDAPGAE